MKKLILLVFSFGYFLNSFSQQTGTFTDARDGHVYKTVKIGKQTWFAENLAFKPDNGNFAYPDNNSSNLSKYGYLYDWQTAISVCPVGWHLPSDDEWIELEIKLGMNEIDANNTGFRGKNKVGNKLKSEFAWYNNGNGNNKSGFNALPAGYVTEGGISKSYGGFALFWTNSKIQNTNAWLRYMSYDSDQVYRNNTDITTKYSVRCIKD